MPWPVPQPTDIYSRAGAVFTAQFPSFQPSEPNTVCGAVSRIVGMTAFDLYGYQSYVMAELFPDTTQDNLDRHAGNWGLTRIPAQAGSGTISWPCTTTTVLPAGIVFSDGLGNAYLNTAGGTATGGTSITLAVTAASAGAQGNLATGTVLTPVSPVAGMASAATVASPGFSNGAVAETDTALRARLLQRIRARGRGGNNADYQQWAEAASSLVAYVQTVPQYLGPGSVGIFIAESGPAVAGSGVLSAVASYLGAGYAAGGVAPVTAYVQVYSATLQTLNATIHLIPDTTANRTAATNAFTAFVAGTAQIGGTITVADLDAAIKGGSNGVFTFDRSLPAADVVCGTGVIAVAGTLSFV
jgi:uncharacterized phage protein gp47/JayE